MDESFLTTLGRTSLIFRTPKFFFRLFSPFFGIQPKALMCFLRLQLNARPDHFIVRTVVIKTETNSYAIE